VFNQQQTCELNRSYLPQPVIGESKISKRHFQLVSMTVSHSFLEGVLSLIENKKDSFSFFFFTESGLVLFRMTNQSLIRTENFVSSRICMNDKQLRVNRPFEALVSALSKAVSSID